MSDPSTPTSPLTPADAAVAIAVDVSNTLDSQRLSGLQRMAVRVTEQLSERSDVALTLLDGRSGTLRAAPQVEARLGRHFSSGKGTVFGRAERRLARAVPAGRRWQPAPGAWLLDLEPSWHGPQPRTELLPAMSARGVTTAAVVPDLLPILHPEWFPPQSVNRFRAWLEAHRDAGSTWFVISEATADDLSSWADGASVHVVRLGVDPVSPPGDGANRWPGSHGLILVLGTVEPRKGHTIVLDALDHLGERAPTVDVVGGEGWAGDDLIRRLSSHPKVRWHRSVSDDDLNELLDHTSLLLQPSQGEGFGLPVAEALARGIPVVATDLPVLAEASRGAAHLVESAVAAWADALDRFTSEPAFAKSLAALAVEFEPFTWADTAADLLAELMVSAASRSQR